MLTLLLAGAGLSACSSGPSASPPPRAAATTSTTARSTAGTATTSPSPTTATTSASAAGSSRCPTGDLVASIAGSSGAAGTIEVTVALRSTSATTCVLGGYPGLQLLGEGGSSLPTTVVRKGAYGFTAMAPTTVDLAPGQSAEFNIGYSDVPVGTETACPTSSSLQITPPNADDHLTIAASLGPCAHGTLVVSPVFAAGAGAAGSSAPAS